MQKDYDSKSYQVGGNRHRTTIQFLHAMNIEPNEVGGNYPAFNVFGLGNWVIGTAIHLKEERQVDSADLFLSF